MNSSPYSWPTPGGHPSGCGWYRRQLPSGPALESSLTGWCVEGRPLLPSASLVTPVRGQARFLLACVQRGRREEWLVVFL